MSTELLCHFCEKPITDPDEGDIFFHNGRGGFPIPNRPEQTDCVVAHGVCGPQDGYGYHIAMNNIMQREGILLIDNSKDGWIEHMKRKNWTDVASLLRFANYTEAVLALREKGGS